MPPGPGSSIGRRRRAGADARRVGAGPAASSPLGAANEGLAHVFAALGDPTRLKLVAVLCAGDPFFYGSYAHLHERLAEGYTCEVIPGIPAMSGCWTRAATPMTCGDEMLSVLSGTMDADRLAERLAAADAAVIMKVGRNLARIRAALARAGLLERAIYVERGTMPEERICRLADKADDDAAYFGVVLVPGRRRPL